MTQTSDTSRIERLEALAQTTLLAIQQLNNRDQQFEQQHVAFMERMDALASRQENLASQQEVFQQKLDATQHKIDAIAEQTALNTAGIAELRNLVADLIRLQS